MSDTIDRGALVMADLAWIETPGPPADRTKAASAEMLDRFPLYPGLELT